jgi:hypothetical protein
MTYREFEEAQAAILEAVERLKRDAGYTYIGGRVDVDIDADRRERAAAANFIYAMDEAIDTYFFVMQKPNIIFTGGEEI